MCYTWAGTIPVRKEDSYHSNKHFSKNVLKDKEARMGEGIVSIEVVGVEVEQAIMMLDHSINFALIFIVLLIMKFSPRFILVFLK